MPFVGSKTGPNLLRCINPQCPALISDFTPARLLRRDARAVGWLAYPDRCPRHQDWKPPVEPLTPTPPGIIASVLSDYLSEAGHPAPKSSRALAALIIARLDAEGYEIIRPI